MTFGQDPQDEGFFDEDEEADLAAREARQEDDLIEHLEELRELRITRNNDKY